MLEINCPYCGNRPQAEFTYGGDGSIQRPALNTEISDQEWEDFVYNRNNPRGEHTELWQHSAGCRQWFKARRNTVTHQFNETFPITP